MNIVALFNIKGGVGKTASAVNLAYLAAESGIHTLLWDLDAQGGASWYLHAEADPTKLKKVLSGKTPIGRLVQHSPHARLDVIAADFSYRFLDVALRKSDGAEATLTTLLEPFSEQYSLIILDCPPSLSHLADNVFAAADLILAPVIPTVLSLRALGQLQAYFEENGHQKKRLKPFYSLVDRRRALHSQLLDEPPACMKNRMRTPIPYSSMIEKMGEFQAPVGVFAPPSHIANLAYRALWKETQITLKKLA